MRRRVREKRTHFLPFVKQLLISDKDTKRSNAGRKKEKKKTDKGGMFMKGLSFI